MSGYNQFCPMAMAAELLCKRWNLIILRELHLGSTHFNELRRGIPKIFPTLLSLRLKELKSAGIIEGTTILNGKASSSYSLTQSGRETFDVILALGNWGQNWFEQRAITGNSEPELLMWDLQRNIFCDQLPQRNLVIQFIFSNEKQYPKWWLLFEPPSSIDLGHTDPGFDPDNLYIGVDVPLDKIYHEGELNKVSDNAMDTNWGGVNYSRRVVSSGYYDANTRKV